MKESQPIKIPHNHVALITDIDGELYGQAIDLDDENCAENLRELLADLLYKLDAGTFKRNTGV